MEGSSWRTLRDNAKLLLMVWAVYMLFGGGLKRKWESSYTVQSKVPQVIIPKDQVAGQIVA